ncbi:hypothetical protein SLCC85_20454 [Listeria monocytogenes]|nr:hypothetical protein SLCC85_20454 [Listeria monocytogenes]
MHLFLLDNEKIQFNYSALHANRRNDINLKTIYKECMEHSNFKNG